MCFGVYKCTLRRATWQVLMIPERADAVVRSFRDEEQTADFLSYWVSPETVNEAMETARLYGHASIRPEVFP